MDGIRRLIDQVVHVVNFLVMIFTKYPIIPATIMLIIVMRWSKRRVRSGGHRRDTITLIGLSTWRPLWRYRYISAPLIFLGWLVYIHQEILALALAGAVGIAWVMGQLNDVLAAEQDRARALGVADRFLLACVESHVQGTNRWLRNPYPEPIAARPVGENVELTVKIPPAMDVERLSTYDEMLGAALEAQAVRIIPAPWSPLANAVVEVLYRALTPGFSIQDVCLADTEDSISVGVGFRGPVMWRPDLEPGLGIFGGTGAGKGRTARWVALQWLDPRFNRRLILIDPQGSGEWSSLAKHPHVTYLPFKVTDAVGSMTAIRDALGAVLADVELRNQLCGHHGVDRWADLSQDIKDQNPRTLVLVDEASALLAKVTDDDQTKALRMAIGTMLAVIYRTVRKGGYSPCHVDQFSYSGGSYLGDGAIGQLGRWVALGGIRGEHRQMIAGFQDWPYYSPVPGLGLTGVRADTSPEPIEQPNIDRALTDATLSAWGVTLSGESETEDEIETPRSHDSTTPEAVGGVKGTLGNADAAGALDVAVSAGHITLAQQALATRLAATIQERS